MFADKNAVWIRVVADLVGVFSFSIHRLSWIAIRRTGYK